MTRSHREFVVGLAGPRALLLQASHPVAFAGFLVRVVVPLLLARLREPPRPPRGVSGQRADPVDVD
jgi:hypothetical protein